MVIKVDKTIWIKTLFWTDDLLLYIKVMETISGKIQLRDLWQDDAFYFTGCLKNSKNSVNKAGLQWMLASDFKQFLSHNLEAELAPFHLKLQGMFESEEPFEDISLWGVPIQFESW